ncbi:MAG: NAD(P)H-dependent oxidoreductase [Mangrovicoccus sp.]
MKALVVYCHPIPGSFNSAIYDLTLRKLQEAGAEVKTSDLYGQNFQPVLSAAELETYLDCPENEAPVAEEVAKVRWCDTLIFIYPTWWYGHPAMLKGWLDRVLLPDVAFLMPDAENQTIRPGLQHITRLGVLTTCGASWWLTRFIGFPGKRTLLRGIGLLCAKPLKTVFAAHFLMDSSTPQSRAKHLRVVERRLERFLGKNPTPVAKHKQGATA